MIRHTYKSRLSQIAAKLDERAKSAAKLSAIAIEQDAKARVPVASGSLRDAIHTVELDDGYAVVAGDSDAWYGMLVENGTVKVPPRPFLIPSAEAERQHLVKNGRRMLSDL